MEVQVKTSSAFLGGLRALGLGIEKETLLLEPLLLDDVPDAPEIPFSLVG